MYRIASENPDHTAYEFLGLRVTYTQFLEEVDSCAAGLYHRGIRKGDRVTVCLPNIPQCMIVFYALNKLGAISSMIHPLSASEEIHHYLRISKSKAAVTLDAFYPRFQHILKGTPTRMLILTKMTDHMTKTVAAVFHYTKGRKNAKVPLDLHVVWWKQIMNLKTRSLPEHPAESMVPHELAVILYSGGTTGMPMSIKNRFDELLAGGGSSVQLREGYGLTETVTVCTVMPASEYRQNSIGIPLPDMLAKVVEPGTRNEVPTGEDGELCIHGPTMMLGYLDQPEETAEVIQRHEDGFIYFKLRIKRMIKVSGISVYPTQTEKILDSHPDVNMCCVIGIPDAYQMSILKAFVVLHDENRESRETEQELISHCRERINKFSCPKSIEFRSELPMTRVGKIAFTELEKEEIERASHQEDVKRDLIEERSKTLT